MTNVGPKWNPGSLNASCIQTLLIHHQERRETPKDAIDRFISLSMRKLLPQLTFLTGFACRMILSEDEFDKLTTAASDTLRSLVLHFDYRLPKLLFMFNRLQSLQELSLIGEHHLTLRSPSGVPDLPLLRRLELTGKESDVMFIMEWLIRMPTSRLEVLGIRPTTILGPSVAREFFERHCGNLSTLALHCISVLVRNDLLRYTPHLQYLELDDFACITNSIRYLPYSVCEVISTEPIFYKYGYLEDLMEAVKQLPIQHPLRRFRIRRHSKFLDSRALEWNEGLVFDRTDVNMVPHLKGLAAQFEWQGKELVDENGVSLRRYLASIAEVQPSCSA
jgi:hypothetical protein